MLIASLIGGLLLLWLGGEAFVRGSVAVAQRLNVSQLMIGLTLVGFGTSLPELVTSVTAAIDGSSGLAVGNVIGSNIANVLLIMAIAALIKPLVCRPDAFYRDATALTLATIVGTAFIFSGSVTRPDGVILLVGLAIYIALVYIRERPQPGPAGEILIGEAQVAERPPETLLRAGALVVSGLAAVVGGAWLLVNGAVELALIWGVSKTYIGLTIVAIGTSLPELVITAVASLRGRSDVALGNIMGSNMFNTLAILGVTALVEPIDVPVDLESLDIAAMLAATFLLIATAATGMRVQRWEGAALLAAYVAYMVARTGVAVF
jgi:cation:H+ antiporter